MPPLEPETRVYLDNNSTTPCAPEVVAEMLPYFATEYGNASSAHSGGYAAAAAVARAREEVAAAIGAQSDCIVFTSGATEANNLAILGTATGNTQRRKVVVSAVEHKSVLVPASRLAQEGYELVVLPVDRSGLVVVDAAKRAIDEQTLMVSIQAANNETGVVQPVTDIVKIAHAQGTLCHCDAVQALGKTPVDVDAWGVDTAAFSAHKVYGPKGVGALFVRRHLGGGHLRPMVLGGRQEKNLRAGTLNVPGIVGFGCACKLVCQCLQDDMVRVSALRAACEEDLVQRIPAARVNGRDVRRLPGTISLTIPGVPSDMLIANLKTVLVSDGSACNSGSPEPSHVLMAMSVSRSDAECTIRISLGRYTTDADIRAAISEIAHVAQNLRARLAVQ